MGMVSPAEFIPVAEESGLIVEVGAWVIQEVKKQIGQWADMGMDALTVSLNLSPRQLKQAEDMAEILELLKFERAQSLVVEITEGVLVDDSDVARDFINQVRGLGIKVALDDFGTGFSSLSYLREYNFDVLKIDRAFVSSIDTNTRDLGLVASIVSMGKILGMRIIAEGAETDAQVEHLRQIGCDRVQGFYYSKPIPADAFVEFYNSRKA
jgi:EAL domain-containing protein (putative c-di-GMP-specific phosphodiesterase class I)